MSPAEATTPSGKAHVMFGQLKSNALMRLNRIIKTQDTLVSLRGYRDKSELSNGIEKLDADLQDLQAARDFLVDPVPKLRELLMAQNVDELAVNIYCRAAKERSAAEGPYLKQLTDAIAERGSSGAAYLKVMRDRWGEWTMRPAENRISFQNTFIQKAYQQASQEFVERTRAVTSAAEALSNWNKTTASAR
jgi:hypothetical protein